MRTPAGRHASMANPGENKRRAKAFIGMSKRQPPVTGPMNMQPVEYAAISPALPLMPRPGQRKTGSAPQQRPARMDAIRKAKARVTRRASLLKQREGQKANLR